MVEVTAPAGAYRGYTEITWGWCLASSLLMACGYVLYIGMYLSGGIVPNPTTWCLWALGGGVEAWTYHRLVQTNKTVREATSLPSFWSNPVGWLWAWIQRDIEPLELASWVCFFFACIVAGIGLTTAALGYLHILSSTTAFSRPDDWELMVAIGDIVVVLVYAGIRMWKGDNVAAKTATLLMTIDIFLSFLPIWRSTLQDPSAENPLPWIVWTGCYCILGATALLQTGHEKGRRRWLLIYPMTSALFHGAVGVFAFGGA